MASSWRSCGSPKGRDYRCPGSGVVEGASDSEAEQHMGYQSKRLKFLSRNRSRSSSPCSSCSPRTPGSQDSSPRASGSGSSSGSGDSHWSFPSPKVFSLSKSFGRRLGFTRSSSANSKEQIITSNNNSKNTLAADGDRESGEDHTGKPNAVMLDKLPDDEEEREDYMTVVVGESSGRREKYVINRQLLDHHLLQTLMKCSEDMVGSPEFRSRALLFCDPALFLHLVEVVGADLALESGLTGRSSP